MKKIIYGLIIICVVLIALTFFSLFGKSTNKTIQISEKLDITSLNDVYNYVDGYVRENLGNKYKLYQIKAGLNKKNVGEIEFIYTERTKYFRDVYFITVNTEKFEIYCERQSEANRGYGRDILLNPEKWKIDFKDMLIWGENIEFDNISWNTVYEDKISVKYIKNGKTIYTVDAHLYTKEIIGSW